MSPCDGEDRRAAVWAALERRPVFRRVAELTFMHSFYLWMLFNVPSLTRNQNRIFDLMQSVDVYINAAPDSFSDV